MSLVRKDRRDVKMEERSDEQKEQSVNNGLDLSKATNTL